jgi:hypothetical protein
MFWMWCEAQYAAPQTLLKLSYVILIMTQSAGKWTLHLQEWPLSLEICVMVEVQPRNCRLIPIFLVSESAGLYVCRLLPQHESNVLIVTVVDPILIDSIWTAGSS